MINNHGINIKDIKEEIDAHGPVDAILRNFESQSMDSESFMNYDSVDQIQYNHNNQISDIINWNIDNFKQGIYMIFKKMKSEINTLKKKLKMKSIKKRRRSDY